MEKSFELSMNNAKFSMNWESDFISMDFSTGNNVLQKFRAAILVGETTPHPYYATFSEFSLQNKTIEDFLGEETDELGNARKLRLPCIFTSIDKKKHTSESHHTIPGWIEIKLYSDLSPALSNPDQSYLSIQIGLDYVSINASIQNSTNSSLSQLPIYGFAPIYARNGKLTLGNSSTNPKSITFYSNGNQSWSINYLLDYSSKWHSSFNRIARINMENQDYRLSGRYQSEIHSVITNVEKNQSLVLGFITTENQFGRILMDRIGNNGFLPWLCAYSQTDAIKLGDLNKGLQSSEIIMLGFSEHESYSVLSEICRFGGLLAHARIESEAIAGFCSWYYYYTKVREEDMLSNLKFFKSRPDLPIDLIQLDDGFQTCIGDWGIEPPYVFNEKFPHGLKWLVDEINKNGFRAGLWVAPFFMTEKAELFQQHQEWALQNINSNKVIKTTYNWGSWQYGMDLSRPDTLTHIEHLGHTTAHEFGFDFLKIDFLYASAVFGAKHHDPSLSRAQLIRNGVSAFRKGLGEDKLILGCGAPLGPCIGLVDVMRIGCDTAAKWAYPVQNIADKYLQVAIPSLMPALRATIQRTYMHKTYWINDPDCVVVRENRSKLSLDEVILQLTIFGLSGGQVLISDDEPLVSDERLDLLKKILPPGKSNTNIGLNGNAIPLDIFQTKIPCLYARDVSIGNSDSKYSVTHHLVSIINWDKSTQKEYKISDLLTHFAKQTLNSSQIAVFDFWEEKLLKICSTLEDSISVSVAKHGCRYLGLVQLSFLDTYNIQFIGSTLHILQGHCEITEIIYNRNNLSLKLALKGIHSGNLFFIVKSSKMVISEEGYEIIPLDQEYNLLKISLLLDKSAHLNVKLGN